MQSIFFNGIQKQQAMPVAAAIVLHVIIAIGIITNFQTDAQVATQMVRVNFVAPSFNGNHNISNAKIIDENGKNYSKDNNDKNRQTSGVENQNSANLSSAITEPIFNAEYLNNPAPVYPASAKRDGIEGKVLLLVDVASNGSAKYVHISKSSGYALLDNSASNTVKNWKFVPAKKFGTAIESQVIVPIEFKLA